MQTEKKRPLVVLTGPTAVGKTGISTSLAKALGGEIISADSMQVYEYMDIGSAKISSQDMAGVRHHLIDIIKPWEEFNVVVFKDRCTQAMEEIYGRGNIPILVGGTGFYIQAVLYDIDFTKTCEDEAYRKELEELAALRGAGYLHDMLKKADPDAADQIHPNNVKRVIRALEFYRQTGQCISAHNEKERQKKSAYASCYFVLNEDRAVLYERIERRVDDMMRDGLLEEVRRLKDMGCTRDMVSMQGLGYKELLDYLDGAVSLEEAVGLIKKNTRHFAKRQLTWFKREKDVIWVDKQDFEDEGAMVEYMAKMARKEWK